MKKLSKDRLEKLRKAFSVAYYERENVEVSQDWATGVMSQIRAIGWLDAGAGYLELLESMIWRYAPVACLLILILGVVIIRFDLVSEYSTVQLFIDDPLDYSFLEYIG